MDSKLIALGILYFADEVLLQLRSEEGPLNGLWEFPGGKIEGTESGEETVVRELKEELGLDVDIENCKLFKIYPYQYNDRKVILHCYMIKSEKMDVMHGKWHKLNEINDIPEANFAIIEDLKKVFLNYGY